MIVELSLDPSPDGESAEARITLVSDSFSEDRRRILYTRIVLCGEGLGKEGVRFLLGTKEDPGRFLVSRRFEAAEVAPFMERLKANWGYHTVVLQGKDRPGRSVLSRRGGLDLSGGLAQGLRLMARHQPRRATIALCQILDRTPVVEGVYYLLGKCLCASGHTQAATDALDYETRRTWHRRAPFEMARILEERGDHDTARAYYKESVRRDGLNLAALVSLARAHAREGNFGAYLSAHRRAHFLAGHEKSVMGLAEEAAPSFGLDPDDIRGLIPLRPLKRRVLKEVFLCRVLLENGAFQDARAHMEHVLNSVDDRPSREALCEVFACLVEPALQSLSPWQAPSILPSLLRALNRFGPNPGRSMSLAYGAVLEACHRGFRKVLGASWRSRLLEDMEQLAMQLRPSDGVLRGKMVRMLSLELQDSLSGAPSTIWSDVLAMLREASQRGSMSTQVRHGYFKALLLGVRTAAERGRDEVAPVLLEEALSVAAEIQDKTRRWLRPLASLEETLAFLVRTEHWSVLDMGLTALASSRVQPLTQEKIRERLAHRLGDSLPDGAREYARIVRLWQRRVGPEAAGAKAGENSILERVKALLRAPEPRASLSVVSSAADGSVFVNGRKVGKTPCRIQKLTPGRYTVGVENLYQKVFLAEGQVLMLTFDLDAELVEVEECGADPPQEAERILQEELSILEEPVLEESPARGLIEMSENEGITIIRVIRDITPSREEKFQKEVLRVWEAAAGREVVVDLSGVGWVGSSCLELLARIYCRNGRRGLVLVRGERPDFRLNGVVVLEVQEVFEYLLTHIPATRDLEAAVGLARQGGRAN